MTAISGMRSVGVAAGEEGVGVHRAAPSACCVRSGRSDRGRDPVRTTAGRGDDPYHGGGRSVRRPRVKRSVALQIPGLTPGDGP